MNSSNKNYSSKKTNKHYLTKALAVTSLLTLVACDSQQNATNSQDSAQSAATLASLGFASQAEAGASLYTSNCATCHGASLEGTILGPILSGRPFLTRWGTQTPMLLLNNITTNMPPGGNDNISPDDYINIVAHILSTNGVDGVSEALTEDTGFTIAENISTIPQPNQQTETFPAWH